MPKKEQKYWLMKSEPSCYSIDDLQREKIGMWDGVRNYQARNFIRDMQKGDTVLFYHSNEAPIGIVGLATVQTEAYPDPTQFDSKNEHYDVKSAPESPRWSAVNLLFKKKFKEVLTLAEIKNNPKLMHMSVAQKGNRLSVMPVSKTHFECILEHVNISY